MAHSSAVVLSAIVSSIAVNPDMTRTMIIRSTGLAEMTVRAYLRQLLATRLIVRTASGSAATYRLV